MTDMQDVRALPKAKAPDGKRLRERFRYAVLPLDPLLARLLKDMKRTLVALAKLAQAWPPENNYHHDLYL